MFPMSAMFWKRLAVAVFKADEKTLKTIKELLPTLKEFDLQSDEALSSAAYQWGV